MEDPIHACFQASYRRLVGQLYGVCGDLTEAEEVVAEAFTRAVSRRRSFERLDNPESWLRTVAVNVARSRHRRRRLGETLLGRTAEQEIERRPELSDDRLLLVGALRRLTRTQREVLALHYLADLSVADVAEALGVPVGTVKARLSRARSALVVVLDDDDALERGGTRA